MEALRWTATEENPIRAASVRTHDLEAHNSQVCMVHSTTVQKEGSLVTVKKDGCEQRS